MLLLLPIAAALAAFLSYRLLEERIRRSWIPAGFRAVGWCSVALLLENGSCRGARMVGRPLVLLDASLGMQAAGGRWQEALALARRIGEVRLVGIQPRD